MATKRLGKDVYIKYDTNNVGGGSASWTTIALQVDRGMDGSLETIDGKTIENDGWAADYPVGASWNLTCTARFDPNDSTHTALYNAWKNWTTVYIQLDQSSIGGSKREGQAYVKKFAEKFPLAGFVDVDLEFAMQGAPVASTV